MIHRKNGITCDPSSDPILDIITVDDIWKYSVKQTSDEGLPYDVQKLFEQRWKAIAGKNGKAYHIESVEDKRQVFAHFMDSWTGPVNFVWNKLYRREEEIIQYL